MAISAAEQYLLELINRARLDPGAEAARYGVSLNSGLSSGTIDSSSKQVLAHNTQLETAAVRHSNWMLNQDTFSHTGAGGSNPGQRMQDAGYNFAGSWTWRENLAWTGSTGSISMSRAVEQHHAGLYRSSGHRANTFAEDIREVGLAQVSGKFSYQGNTYNASMLTEKFAKSGGEVFITGVAYIDRDKDKFYSIGEARKDVWVRAQGDTEKTAGSGGYAVEVDKHANTSVTVGIGGKVYAQLKLDTTDGNVKLDMVKVPDGAWSLDLSGSANLGSGIAHARLLGRDNLDLSGSGAANRLTGNKGQNDLSGEDGDDDLRGMDGNDDLAGGWGRDELRGGNGRDYLSGNNQNDSLWGHKGNDVLNGGKAQDKLWGGDGADRLNGGKGDDIMVGGKGEDRFVFASGKDVIRDFENNIDTIEVDRDVLGGADVTKQDVMDAGRIANGNAIFTFDDGHRLTVEGVTNLDHLSNDLILI